MIEEQNTERTEALIDSIMESNQSSTSLHDERMINCKTVIEDYINKKDWRTKENASLSDNVGALILNNSAVITANYWLSEVYDREIADAHRNADIHIHDLSMLTGYCAGWSLKQLIKEGLGGITGKITSAPASHLSTLCNQMVNFLGIMQNEWAGAQAFSSFDTYLAPFVKVDNLTYKEVKQCIQSFIYGVNTPSRWGTQAPFTNVTLDWVVPNDLANLNCIVGGKEMDFCYKDCEKEMAMINKAFIEIMIEGDANGRGFQYPIPTYSITKDFDWSETENNKLLFEMTAKYGTPYFSNYINSDMEPSDVRSMCVLPNTLVWTKTNGRTKHTTIEDFYQNHNDTSLILTKYGYRPVKEYQRFTYNGEMLRFVTDSGKEITTTTDHEHIVYDKNGRLVKKKAYRVEVGETYSCRNKNAGELRKGKTYAEIYGEDRAQELKNLYHKQRIGQWAGEKNPSYGGLSAERREKISLAQQGHAVSDKCRAASAERWKGNLNPFFRNGRRVNGRNVCISKYEEPFAKELDTLDLKYESQYRYGKANDGFADFYIPEKNLLIELETNYNYDTCAYNDFSKLSNTKLKARYEKAKSLGYNVLVFNPEKDQSSYRKYINSTEKIVKIESIPYSGYVYDVEVNCDDIVGDTSLYHAFYANEILTGNCCRLRLDLRELRKKSGGFFGSGESTGSVGVVTINMPRIAYLSETEEEFFARLDHMMDIAARSLKVKRNVVSELLEKGLYPYTKRYLGTFNNHFSTIGLVGMNEACLNAKWIGKDLTNEESQEFTKKVLNHMRTRLSDYQEMYGDLYNLEATPAESTSFRLAKHDKKRYPDMIFANQNGTTYYTNSSHLPVGYTSDIFTALDIQDELQTLYTSGTVFHAFLGQKLNSWKEAASLVRKIAENYRLPYYTLSPTYSVCQDHGYISGEAATCPICGKGTEIYSRITGYYRPVQNWNDGKTQEFADRKTYDVATSACKRVRVKEEEAVVKEEKKEVFEEANLGGCGEDGCNFSINEEKEILLFATKTCPNCRMAKLLLDKAGIRYKVIDAEEQMELTVAYKIKKAPTLLVPNEDGEYIRYENVSNVKAWIEQQR